ncbi:hypothetical protein ALT_6854 [Aspergillus lentulus]|uniref:Uncharacterized protein n=1 Tax=Aspergillus lentulus TaxID=293939 RepID=A0AAN4TD32_ASPLE|nr:hypothetical protein ALT_6854 [Aspergillus lentulus]GFF63680.1 hypothetical protein IFM47457_00446 [Aspergillus lentulus]
MLLSGKQKDVVSIFGMIGKLEAYHYIPRLVEDIIHKDTRSWSGNRSVYVPQSKPISNLSWVMQMVSAFRLVASNWTYARSLKNASGGGPTDDDGARAVLLGTGTNDVTGELEPPLSAAHYNCKLKTTSHYKVQFRHMTKNYEREDLYLLRQTDDNDEYSNTGFLYGSKRKGPDATTAALITAEAINCQSMASPVRAAFMQILNTLDSKRHAELNRQVDAAIQAAFNPAPNRSVELDDDDFAAVKLFDQKGTHLGWLGPNGQVVKIQNDGPLGIFQLEYTPETPDEASRRAPGRHELKIPAEEATGSATGTHKLNIPHAQITPTLQIQQPPP